MLIVQADIYGHRAARADVRILNGRIAALGDLQPAPGEAVLDAYGGALLPGLHDHHLHLMSYAASLGSVRCGPPDVRSDAELIAVLERRAAEGAGEWIRGIGYHESVAGDINRHWLDRHGPDVPIRIQHRSGRLWILNSRALQQMARRRGSSDSADDGRLYDQDLRLRAAIGASLPPVGEASRTLAAYGVTGVTDMTPHNSGDDQATFARLRADGTLLQRLRLAGTPDLTPGSDGEMTVGETKIHLHESGFPPFDQLCDSIRSSHVQQRGVAVHCVTEAELVFALAAFREASADAGDRIEHASVTPPALLDQIRELGLSIVTQPNFIIERGDAYLSDIPAPAQDWLYRCRTFLDAGIPVAGGTDAPFGHADPWLAMHGAVHRRTRKGQLLGPAERVTPEQALAMFTGEPGSPARPRIIAPGAIADLCLLTIPWTQARTALSSEHVRATVIGGNFVWTRAVSGDCGS
jgi:predicted amidohydrolase YtcJ